MGSLHTHLGHADGASGAASLIKIVLQATQAKIPAIVHFRSLNPLATGLHDSRHVKTVDISTFGAGKVALPKLGQGGQGGGKNGFRALFPMGAAPHVCCATAGEAAPSLGASSFGFGGSMAHVIVSAAGSTPAKVTRDLAYGPASRVPLYPPAPAPAGGPASPPTPVATPGTSSSAEDPANAPVQQAPPHQALAEQALATIESQLRGLLQPWLGARALSLPRAAPLLFPDALAPAEAAEAVARHFSGAFVALNEEGTGHGASVSHLAAAVLDSLIKKGVGSFVTEDSMARAMEGFLQLLEPQIVLEGGAAKPESDTDRAGLLAPSGTRAEFFDCADSLDIEHD